tara:strand:- start:79 stop:1281 length:1203 start_codon:yes stop_codon:yes gene_type:complete
MKKILNIVVLLILKFLSLFIRKENMVIIGTYSRYRYGGNTKYLYEYLSMNTDLQVYWLTESMEIIDYLKSKGLKYLTNKKLFKKLIVTLKCKVIIDSGTGYYNPFNYFSSNPNILKISTMHGSGPKLTVERKENIEETLNLIKKINTFNCVSFCTEYSRVTIGINQLLLSRDKTRLFGLPKHDLLHNHEYINSTYKKRKWVKAITNEKNNINKSKVIYYTPTYRTTYKTLPIRSLPGFSVEEFDAFLEKEDIYFIYSFHSMNSSIEQFENTKRIKFVSDAEYPLFDNFELMIESDMMIGDYSTLATDFSLMSKPQLFIMPDYKEVYESKGFAEDLKPMLPGEEITTFNDLKEAIIKYIMNQPLFLDKFKNNIDLLQSKYADIKKYDSREMFKNYILTKLK